MSKSIENFFYCPTACTKLRYHNCMSNDRHQGPALVKNLFNTNLNFFSNWIDCIFPIHELVKLVKFLKISFSGDEFNLISEELASKWNETVKGSIQTGGGGQQGKGSSECMSVCIVMLMIWKTFTQVE